MKKDEKFYKTNLTKAEYEVLRKKGTEPAFSGKYVDAFDKGVYKCKACGAELFASGNKYHSNCGWPSFDDVLSQDKVKLTTDQSHGMTRTEVTCSNCGSHLGHLFDDGPVETTGKRFCINSVSLDFKQKNDTDSKHSKSN